MPNKKILIVDDDTNICELLRLYLEKDGFDTVIANDGEAAIVKFNLEEPDLILLDIMLRVETTIHLQRLHEYYSIHLSMLQQHLY